MQIKYELDKTKNVGFGAVAEASYNHFLKTTTVNIGKIYADAKRLTERPLETLEPGETLESRAIDYFVIDFTNSLVHETLHHSIMSMLEVDHLNIGDIWRTKNEWIVRKVLEEKMNEWTLLSYVAQDIAIHNFNRTSQKRDKLLRVLIYANVALVISLIIQTIIRSRCG